MHKEFFLELKVLGAFTSGLGLNSFESCLTRVVLFKYITQKNYHAESKHKQKILGAE